MPATAAARVQALTAELRTLAGVVGRRETAVLKADGALTYQPADLWPRATTLFALRPHSGESFASRPWSGLDEGEIDAALNGQRIALRAILRRYGERLSGPNTCLPRS